MGPKLVAILLLPILSAACINEGVQAPDDAGFDASGGHGAVVVVPARLLGHDGGEWLGNNPYVTTAGPDILITDDIGSTWLEPDRTIRIDASGRARPAYVAPDGLVARHGGWGDGKGIFFAHPRVRGEADVDTVATWDLERGEWTAAPLRGLPYEGCHQGRSAVAGGAAFIWGCAGHEQDVYRLGEDGRHSRLAILPSPVTWATGVVHSGSLYLFGGFAPGRAGFSDTVQTIDLATGTVQGLGPSMPWPDALQGGASDGQGIYLFGGMQGADRIVRFDPASETAIVMASRLPGARSAPGVAWDGEAFVIAGGKAIGHWADVLRYRPREDEPATASREIAPGWVQTNRVIPQHPGLQPTMHAAAPWWTGLAVARTLAYDGRVVSYDEQGEADPALLGGPYCCGPWAAADAPSDLCLTHCMAFVAETGTGQEQIRIADMQTGAESATFSMAWLGAQGANWMAWHGPSLLAWNVERQLLIDLGSGVVEGKAITGVRQHVPGPDAVLGLDWNWMPEDGAHRAVTWDDSSQSESFFDLPAQEGLMEQGLWWDGRYWLFGYGSLSCGHCPTVVSYDTRADLWSAWAVPATDAAMGPDRVWGPVAPAPNGLAVYGVPWEDPAQERRAWMLEPHGPPIPVLSWSFDGRRLTLDGVDSQDPDGGDVRIAWKVTRLNAMACCVTFSQGYSGQKVSFEADPRHEWFAVTLMVTDDEGATSHRPILLESTPGGSFVEVPFRPYSEAEVPYYG